MKVESSTTSGFEYLPPYIHVATLTRKNKTIYVKTEKLEENVKPFYIQAPAATFLEGSEVLLKQLKIPHLFNQDDKLALSFHLEEQLFLQIDETCIGYTTLQKYKKEKEVQAFITKSSNLKNLPSLPCHLISARPLALLALTPYISNYSGTLLHISKKGTTLVFSDKGQLITYKYSSLGTTFLQGEGHKRLNNLYQWQQEIAYLIYLFETDYKTKCTSIIVTGDFFIEEKELSLFQNNFSYPLLHPHIKNMDINFEQFMTYSSSIGAALLLQPKKDPQVNFLKKIPLDYLKKPLSLYYTLSIFLTIFLFFFFLSSISQKERVLKERAFELLKVKESILGEPMALQEDSLETLIDRLNRSSPLLYYPYALTPRTLSIGTLFSKLQKLPLPKEIELDKIHYRLESYPTKETPHTPYKVKVEIFLKTFSPQPLSFFTKQFDEKEYTFTPYSEGMILSFRTPS